MTPDRPGFKELTASNWLDRDPTIAAFASLSGARPSGEQYAEMVLSYELDEVVPDEVRDLWAIARGVLVYGFFFYPLWAVGGEQLHRVTDAAVGHAYRRFGGPGANADSLPSMQSRIEWLIAHRYIDPQWTPRWLAIKDLRNFGSHPTRPSIALPHDALRSLAILRDEINLLFASDEPQFAGANKWKARPGQVLDPPKKLATGDRYELAAQLQSALDHLWDFAGSDQDANADFTAARLLVERTRDRLLGVRAGLPADPDERTP